jgi:hypothetical protein
MRNLTLFFVACTLLSCAGDIKGKDGADAINDPFVRIHRPSFHTSSDVLITVDASVTNPAVFKFGSNVLTVESTLVLNINKPSGGLGGLRGGPLAPGDPSVIYYLYGVKNGTTVELIGDSISPPLGGPQGFTDWTYLGAFPILQTPSLPNFTSSDGFLISSLIGSFLAIETDPTQPAAKFDILVPTTAFSVYLRSYWDTVTSVGDEIYLGAAPNHMNLVSRAESTNPFSTEVSFSWIAVLTPTTVYATIKTAGDKGAISVFGWKESLLDYP